MASNLLHNSNLFHALRVGQLACTPHYTDAAATWVTQDSEHGSQFSIWFNPNAGLSLEDLAQAMESHARDLTQLYASENLKFIFEIQVQRFIIRAQTYSRELLPSYKAADLLKDKEAFNAVVQKRTGFSYGASGCVIS